MAAKIMPLAALLLYLLTWMRVESQENPDYAAFVMRHVDFPKNEGAYCNRIMKEKEETLNYALENTFIHATENEIQDICFLNGLPLTGIRRSRYPYAHTHCVATTEEGTEFSGTLHYDIILIWCENGLPTDFHGHPLPETK